MHIEQGGCRGRWNRGGRGDSPDVHPTLITFTESCHRPSGDEWLRCASLRAMLRTAARSVLATIVCLLLVLALVAACGGGDNDDATDANEPTATQEQDDTFGSGDESLTEADEADDSGLDGGEPVDACALLSADEVEAIVGSPVTLEPDDLPPNYRCYYETENINEDQGYGFEQVAVSVLAVGPEAAEVSYDLSSSIATEEIPGIGEKAQWLGSLVAELEFLDGPYHVSLIISGFGEKQKQQAIAIDLATIIDDRLPN